MKKKKGSNKKKSEVKKSVMLDLFYMSPSEISTIGLVDTLKELEEIKVEYWEAMNVVQVELENKHTIEFELTEIEFEHPSDLSFIKNRKVKTIFAVTMEEEDFDLAKSVYQTILTTYDGFICTDNEDFQPIYQAEFFD